MDIRLERISKLVDSELDRIEALAGPAGAIVDLDRLEALARLIRSLALTDNAEKVQDPFADLPPDLLRQVLGHTTAKGG